MAASNSATPAGTVDARFEAVDQRLRDILAPYRSRLIATKDGPGGLVLEVPGLEGKPRGYFGGTRRGKRYVSFYLMAVYASPDLQASMSPELRRRMQGKSCFNFASIDEPLFEELARITERSFEPFLALARTMVEEKPPARRR